MHPDLIYPEVSFAASVQRAVTPGIRAHAECVKTPVRVSRGIVMEHLRKKVPSLSSPSESVERNKRLLRLADAHRFWAASGREKRKGR